MTRPLCVAIVRDYNPEELAPAIQSLAADAQRRLELGHKAQQTAVRRFNRNRLGLTFWRLAEPWMRSENQVSSDVTQ